MSKLGFFNRSLQVLGRCNLTSTSVKRAATVPISFRQNFSGIAEDHNTNKAFDRSLKILQRGNAANYDTYDYIKEEISKRLVDRLDDIIRDDGFPLALDVGSGPGFLHQQISKDDGILADGSVSGGIGGVRKLVMLDSCKEMLHRDDDKIDTLTAEEKERCGTYKMVGDEEGPLPFPDGTFDLVISSTSTHWVNDLPGMLKEIHRVLKPDGCFLFAMIGGATLSELRSSFVLSELERDGGVSPHVGPFVDFADVGALLTNSGFALTTIDIDTITLGFPNAMVCMEHLQRMGENNASLARREKMNVDTFLAMASIYDHMFQLDDGSSGDEASVEATVQVIYGIGWTPHENQQKPDERGSATKKIGDVVIESTKL